MIDAQRRRRLHAHARASRWQLNLDAFGDALERSAQKAFPGAAPAAADLDRFLATLHLEDLALACACGQGDDEAWRHFVETYRPQLYRAVDAIDRTGSSHDLVDALYGELFGVSADGRERQSLFRYFHGRSSLATWLRAVLSQRIVDRARQRRAHDPVPDDDAPGALVAPPVVAPPERARFVRAMRDALLTVLAVLDASDRIRLACYYAQHMTLARIGRMLGEHESTVSRQLARTRAAMRAGVEEQLRQAHGFSDAELEECFASLTADPATLDLARLLEEADARRAARDAAQPPRKKRDADRSTEGAEL